MIFFIFTTRSCLFVMKLIKGSCHFHQSRIQNDKQLPTEISQQLPPKKDRCNFLAHNKMTEKSISEKSIFCITKCSEITSQSFPVSCLLCCSFVIIYTPPEVKFHIFGTLNTSYSLDKTSDYNSYLEITT